jgi:hypothetical protein
VNVSLFEDLSQSAENVTRAVCKLLILKRRDAGAVDQARLESEAGEERRRIRRDLNAHALNELAAWKYLSV